MKVISEKLDCITVDVPRLQAHFDKYVEPLPKTAQSSTWGGWSVYSASGTHQDGWFNGSHYYKEAANGDQYFDYVSAAGDGLVSLTEEHCKPTEICTGYLLEVMNQIAELGFRPKRARLALLMPGTEIPWHRDYPDNIYGARIHVPISDNKGCFFDTQDDGSVSLKNDGSVYMLWVNRMHRVRNLTGHYRLNLIMDATDMNHRTQHFKFA